MTDRSAVDDHFQLVVDQKAEEKLRRALGLLNSSGIGYIVEGGWAMAAVGSPTPSVDLDVMFRGLAGPLFHALFGSHSVSGTPRSWAAARDQTKSASESRLR